MKNKEKIKKIVKQSLVFMLGFVSTTTTLFLAILIGMDEPELFKNFYVSSLLALYFIMGVLY